MLVPYSGVQGGVPLSLSPYFDVSSGVSLKKLVFLVYL